MRPLHRLAASFEAYYGHSQAVLQSTGLVGLAAFPLLYLLRFAKEAAPYNDLWLRLIAVVLCLLVWKRDRWPLRLRRSYLPFAYVAILFCLPFFFIFTSLANGGGVIAVANTLMAVFFLVLLADWRNTLVMLGVGAAAAVLLYVAIFPDPTVPKDYVGRLPLLGLVVVGGSLFKFAEKRAEAERIRTTYAALAGSIAHEMRNPLARIQHSLDRTLRALPAEPLPPLFNRHLTETGQAVQWGLQLIAMTLDEVSARPVNPASFSVLSAAEAAHRAVQEYSYETEDARQRVTVEVNEDFEFAADETAFLFLMFNLIRNAMFYVPLRADLRIRIVVEPHRIRVIDTGPGIPPDAVESLFEPFRSAGKAGGTGLGLAYCRRVMRAFGGNIDCESVPGLSTSFILSFPVLDLLEVEERHRVQQVRALKALNGMRLLLVEQDPVQRESARQQLEASGLRVDEAADGRLARWLLDRHRYDLVLLNLEMPSPGGWAIAEQLRRADGGPSRFAALVAWAGPAAHLAANARESQVDALLLRPCEPEALVQALDRALARRRRSLDQSGFLVGRRIVLADDSEVNRMAIGAFLRDAGAHVQEVEHGRRVLELLAQQGGADLVLMDLNMPGLDGLQAAHAIRRCGASWSDVPIVALTAYSQSAATAAAESAGMDAFLTKPVAAAELFDTLRRLLLRENGGAVVHEDTAAAQPQALLDLARLESYERVGMLDELVGGSLRELERLLAVLRAATARREHALATATLHSLVGTSGEAGALVLNRHLRAIYAAMHRVDTWPAAADWLDPLDRLAQRSKSALEAHLASRSRSAAPVARDA